MNVKPGHRKIAFILKLVPTLSYRNTYVRAAILI